MPSVDTKDPEARHPRASLSFLGAAGTVTGSRFLIETNQTRIMVDAGLFQGERTWRRRNWDPFPVDPATIDAVVLTHAHLDHCGFLPVLARHGFRGPIWCTPATAELTAIVLADAAHLQEEEAEHSRAYGYSKHHDPRPLFDRHHAARAIALLRPAPFDEAHTVSPGVRATLRPAGHILGSAFAELDVSGTRVMFSGDLGRPGHQLLQPPPPPHHMDVAVVESTYGDETHPPPDEDLLAEAITRTIRRGGTCLLPTFAVDRTPVVVHALSRLRSRGLIPDVPVYVDSPMALRAWDVYRSALRAGDPQFRVDLGPDALDWDKHVVSATDRSESELLNEPAYPCVIVSASGMATGGRVLHHLAGQLPHPRNCVILTGFQVPGTRGQLLADGARSVKIHGRYVPVRADIVNLRGFSAHADAAHMLSWLSRSAEPEVAYVVHGEPGASAALATRLHTQLGWNAVTPRLGERVLLT
jgi:metallo-beta-lactamase family protein